MTAAYTTRLGAGQGMVEETRVLLGLWKEGMSAIDLFQTALSSGLFPSVSARRLRNMIVEAFKSRYLIQDGAPASLLKALQEHLTSRELTQVLFIFTSRANPVLADFVREVYWPAYEAGRVEMTNLEAQAWVKRANQEGKTREPWSPNMVERVAQYVTGCCRDFGLLETTGKRVYLYRIAPYRIEQRVAVWLAYDLHFSGQGDNRLLADPDWSLFGLDRDDALDTLKRVATGGDLIIQAAGGVTRLGWTHRSMEELIDAFAR